LIDGRLKFVFDDRYPFRGAFILAKKAAKKAVKTPLPRKKSVSGISAGVKKIAPSKLKKARQVRTLNPCENDEPCPPYGRLYPNDIRTAIEMGWTNNDNGSSGFRVIPDLLFNYVSLTKADVERLLAYSGLGGLNDLIEVTYKSPPTGNPLGFTWSYFGVRWDEKQQRAIINCSQIWPSTSKKTSKKASRVTSGPYLGDIEISVTWPCENPDYKDERTKQLIKFSNVEISPDEAR
jgi:hypothetical protein